MMRWTTKKEEAEEEEDIRRHLQDQRLEDLCWRTLGPAVAAWVRAGGSLLGTSRRIRGEYFVAIFNILQD